uniref:Beta/gamma crystallin 'Greek key' domain-containing protein n=1 Tax=Sander lucioperca TaxID=283035 RepID=A0A8C9ZS21_SANLU
MGRHGTQDLEKMYIIIFYEERNFQGRHYECMSDCSDMSSYMSRCHSCRVESGCFMVYDRPNYMGNQYFMKRGEYADYMSMMGMRDSIRSCRMIPMHRGQFRMKIYERENFGGQSYELMDDCDSIMDRYRMNDCQSCHVMDGHWLMYEQPNYRGRMMYMRPGEYRSFRDMGMSGMRWMSMRRIMDSWTVGYLWNGPPEENRGGLGGGSPNVCIHEYSNISKWLVWCIFIHVAPSSSLSLGPYR